MNGTNFTTLNSTATGIQANVISKIYRESLERDLGRLKKEEDSANQQLTGLYKGKRQKSGIYNSPANGIPVADKEGCDFL